MMVTSKPTNIYHYIHSYNDPHRNILYDNQLVGGKAKQLHNIDKELVPPWVVITADCPDELLSDSIHIAWSELAHSLKPYPIVLHTTRYAVRSSALAEDGEKKSYAGIFESKLKVPVTGLEQAAREVRLSGLKDMVNFYEEEDGYNYTNKEREEIEYKRATNVAVIIMPMVDAQISGVLFSKEPVGGTDRMLVEWDVGVGGVVDGTKNSRHAFIDKKHFKDNLFPFDPSVFKSIWEEAKRLENNYRKPVDIEWAIDKNGKPWVLQVRPITTC